MKEYCVDNISEFAMNFNITENQSKMLIEYMEGSGYAFGSENGKLYRIDVNEDNGEVIEYSISEATDTIRGWIDDFVADVDIGVESTDDYTLDDMEGEEAYNNYVGGIFGSWAEREEKHQKLLQLKRDDIELVKLK